jgi:predicted dehydrogenase
MSKAKEISRRKFLANAAVSGAAISIVPRHVLGRGFTAPSDTLNIAAVGVGGMGRANLINLASQNIVALCDVDWAYAEKGFSRLDSDIERLRKRVEQPAPSQTGESVAAFDLARARTRLEGMSRLKSTHLPKATRYTDYREMLDRQKDIDGVMVATPDHMHAPIALAAMELGKHVYVQKPLCWSVEEARKLSRRAKETKVATQMGNQGHSSDDGRTAVEYIWGGAIGEVREVHVWTNRPLGYWPQGVPRPEPLKAGANALTWNGRDVNTRIAAALCGEYPIPNGLAWNLFLGAAPENVEYHPIYHPFNWRGWVDWGVGAIGDMGAHLIDHTMWALDLGLPNSIETVSTPFNGASYPSATLTFYNFPARGSMPPVKLTWYDGGLLPNKPEGMGEEELNRDGGALLIGSKGKLLYDTYGYRPRLLPKSLHESFGKPAQKLPRIAGEAHELNWVEAAKGKVEASCPFEYAARLTEVMLLGIVALRAGKKIYYDGVKMEITNVPQANEYLKREYRQGWQG